MMLNHHAGRQKQAFGNLPGLPGLPALPAETVSSTAEGNPPTTRAGGQDDVSSQANSLKFLIGYAEKKLRAWERPR